MSEDEIQAAFKAIRPYLMEDLMQDKKQVVIKLTDEQRAQIKSATGRDITELRFDVVEDANPLAANPLEDRSNPLAVLEDRSNPIAYQ